MNSEDDKNNIFCRFLKQRSITYSQVLSGNCQQIFPTKIFFWKNFPQKKITSSLFKLSSIFQRGIESRIIYLSRTVEQRAYMHNTTLFSRNHLSSWELGENIIQAIYFSKFVCHYLEAHDKIIPLFSENLKVDMFLHIPRLFVIRTNKFVHEYEWTENLLTILFTLEVKWKNKRNKTKEFPFLR